MTDMYICIVHLCDNYLIHTEGDWPFDIQRKRVCVPVLDMYMRVCVNKSQGQSLKVVGLNISPTCFSHGQQLSCFLMGWKQQ